MMLSLADRLTLARYQRFVGRCNERELFTSAIKAIELPFSLLHIFGPGGVGKTTLMWEFLRICQETQTQGVYIDARNIEASAESFLSALSLKLQISETQSPLEILASKKERYVIAIDTYETIAELDNWLREFFLPQLSEQTLVVLASRYPPTSAWRVDPGWQILLRALPLRNLSPKESRIYLNKREIPPTQHESILNFTHGHPLALSLIADVLLQNQDLNLQPEADPDLIKTLLEKFLEEVPSPIHRTALECCAIVRLTTESLLAQMLDISDRFTPEITEIDVSNPGSPTDLHSKIPNPKSQMRSDVREIFNWLRGLSFIESGEIGLFPHDLARKILNTDLRWRNAEWYGELHQRARNYYINRLEQTKGQNQHQILFDYIFLHHDNPSIAPCFTWQQNSGLISDKARESDFGALIEMVAEHEGEESARLGAHWLARQPQGVLVVRDAKQELVGFVMAIELQQANLEDIYLDPATHSAWRYLQNRAPLRPGEGATVFRFWLARDTYQAVSPIQSLIFINLVQYYRNTPGLAFTFLPCAEPDFWAAMFAYADLARIPEADFVVGTRSYGVYGHDWRVVSPTLWQELLAQREIAASAKITTTPPPLPSEPIVVLSQAEFFAVVQDALRNFCRPDALQNNPLLQSKLVVEKVMTKANKNDRIATLQKSIREAVLALESSPKEAKLYRVLYRTYLSPAITQEQAAEALDLPFGTYRRHLKAGIKRVADILWQQEIQ
jgi:hypothetical protein